jgi:hypothetical protein
MEFLQQAIRPRLERLYELELSGRVCVLGAFCTMKLQCDPLIVIVAAVAIAAVFGFQRLNSSRTSVAT